MLTGVPCSVAGVHEGDVRGAHGRGGGRHPERGGHPHPDPHAGLPGAQQVPQDARRLAHHTAHDPDVEVQVGPGACISVCVCVCWYVRVVYVCFEHILSGYGAIEYLCIIIIIIIISVLCVCVCVCVCSLCVLCVVCVCCV